MKSSIAKQYCCYMYTKKITVKTFTAKSLVKDQTLTVTKHRPR